MISSYVCCSLAFAVAACAQTFELTDRHGIPIAIITDVKMFRYSDYFKESVPTFRATVKNVSGVDLHSLSISAVVHKKDGSQVEFSFTVAGPCSVCEFRNGSSAETTHAFYMPWEYTPDNFEAVEFSIPSSWQSPEDARLAAEEMAKKQVAEAKRRRRLAAEQKKLEAERKARLARESEAAEATVAEERRKIRAACATLYKNTAEKRVKDLTVKEEQQVRACQALGLYAPQ